MRVKAIKGWDKLLTWALSPKIRPYVPAFPAIEQIYKMNGKEIQKFNQNYGYFSFYHPIVGLVTKSERDIQATQCLLNVLPEEISNEEQLQFSVDEVLAKIMAYRPLKGGMKISIPNGKGKFATYVVDMVIDLWHGMPAFGLLPEEKGEVPILLFRGTSLELTSEMGWASILSDLDTTGPGHTTFLRGQRALHEWLKKVKRIYEPARAVGFSLGGVFVIYTLIYEYDLINSTTASVAFNAPGVSSEVLKKWDEIPKERRPPLHYYVNRGDFVSRIGLLLPEVWEITLEKPMEVVQAHVTFISSMPEFKMTGVDVELENKHRD